MFGANAMWGLMSPVAKFAMTCAAVSPFAITQLRVFGAAVLFWGASFFQKRERVCGRDMLRLFAASMFAILLNQGCFIFGVGLASPVDASIITTSMPLIALALSAVFLKEAVNGKKVLGIAFGALGAMMLGCSRRRRKRKRRMYLGRRTCFVRAVQLRRLHRALQGFNRKIFPDYRDEMDVHVFVFVHRPVFVRTNRLRRLEYRRGRCAVACVHRCRRNVRKLHSACDGTKTPPPDHSGNVQLHTAARGEHSCGVLGDGFFRHIEDSCRRAHIHGRVYGFDGFFEKIGRKLNAVCARIVRKIRTPKNNLPSEKSANKKPKLFCHRAWRAVFGNAP